MRYITTWRFLGRVDLLKLNFVEMKPKATAVAASAPTAPQFDT